MTLTDRVSPSGVVACLLGLLALTQVFVHIPPGSTFWFFTNDIPQDPTLLEFGQLSGGEYMILVGVVVAGCVLAAVHRAGGLVLIGFAIFVEFAWLTEFRPGFGLRLVLLAGLIALFGDRVERQLRQRRESAAG